jgi:beta-glucanase (GH16 family)
MYREGASGTPTLSLTAVTAYFIQFSDNGGDTSFAGTFALDQMRLFDTVATDVYSFESGMPSGYFADPGGEIAASVVTTGTLTQFGADPNHVLAVSVTAPRVWAGLQGFNLPTAQDWSGYAGVSFWFKGTDSGQTFLYVITQDAGAGLYQAAFVDDSSEWKLVMLPWEAFMYREGASGTPTLSLTAVTAYFIQFSDNGGDTSFAGTFALDQMAVFGLDGVYYLNALANPPGQSGTEPLEVAFSWQEIAVVEGETAAITVTLNMTAAYPVTATYATSDGTAIAGTDYVSTTGALVFPPNTLTQSFTVDTIDNAVEDGSRTLLLTLSNPISVTLGAVNQATLLIQDNEAIDLCRRIMVTVDDFEDGLLLAGQHGTIDIGFITWSDGSSVSIITTTVASGDPLALPGQVGDNIALQFDANIGGWGGLSHLFMNAAGDTWLSQDWSRYNAIGFWLYGEGDGTGLFFEIKDNRTGSDAQDDAEIWTHPFTDDVAGWRYVEIPFSDFTRKEIGNNAPNDGFGRTEVHGWAFGSLGTGGSQTLYLDNVALVERVLVVDDYESGLPSGTDANSNGIGFVAWGSEVPSLSTPLVADTDGLALPCQLGDNHLLQVDYSISGWGGGFSHAFENAGVSEWVSQDWSTYEGLSLWVYGSNTGGNFRLDLFDNRAATGPYATTDSAERFFYTIPDDFTGWQHLMIPFTGFARRSDWQPAGAPDDGLTLTETWGYAVDFPGGVGAHSAYLDYVMLYGDSRQPELTVAFADPEYSVIEGQAAHLVVTLNYTATAPVTVAYATAESLATPDRDFTPVSGTLSIAPGALTADIVIPTLDDGKNEVAERVAVLLFDPEGATLGFQRRTVLVIEDNDSADPNLLDDFEGFHPFTVVTGTVTLNATEVAAASPLALPGQGAYEHVLHIAAAGESEFVRTYPVGQDWSSHDGLSFWFHGTNSGEEIAVQLLDNQSTSTAAVDPAEWVPVWSQEFDEPVGTAPDGNIWTHELGDGALNDVVGWGNSELQYYTNSTDNAATDGAGNLKITLRQVDTENGDLVCHYGMCEYTSARLISANKAEFAYGRVEARVQVPSGAGLWPAFWMLGTNIGTVGWPTSGEIDIMEYVGRIPNEVFGTIHGPGYSGGNGFGNTYDLGEPVADAYHTFAVEWSPDEIHWYVDGINYHNATPADVAPNQWVFNQPFYIILNLAIGGNFGGDVDPTLTYPKEMLVDYVRVYQAADTAERFEATFTDDFAGWRKVLIPFSSFVRSAEQPAGAPNDGLTLTEVWGYGFALPEDSDGTFYLDQVRLQDLQYHYLPLVFKNNP